MNRRRRERRRRSKFFGFVAFAAVYPTDGLGHLSFFFFPFLLSHCPSIRRVFFLFFFFSVHSTPPHSPNDCALFFSSLSPFIRPSVRPFVFFILFFFLSFSLSVCAPPLCFYLSRGAVCARRVEKPTSKKERREEKSFLALSGCVRMFLTRILKRI